MQAMAQAPAHDLDLVRKAINDMRPDKPDAAMHFADDELQRLFDEGYTTVDDLIDASMKSLRLMGLQQACIDILVRELHIPYSQPPRAISLYAQASCTD